MQLSNNRQSRRYSNSSNGISTPSSVNSFSSSNSNHTSESKPEKPSYSAIYNSIPINQTQLIDPSSNYQQSTDNLLFQSYKIQQNLYTSRQQQQQEQKMSTGDYFPASHSNNHHPTNTTFISPNTNPSQSYCIANVSQDTTIHTESTPVLSENESQGNYQELHDLQQKQPYHTYGVGSDIQNHHWIPHSFSTGYSNERYDQNPHQHLFSSTSFHAVNHASLSIRTPELVSNAFMLDSNTLLGSGWNDFEMQM
ncbi:uncharacterized protein BX664DRAFT_67859 [Halteromyces radiatus]|uniref:uncharacterized protein n=1 Tax=Halteromyces radiatus TaxID=101107 RepID=UPI00221FB734|nr:uncharacterized protein BX664DRAFT_67859 [Halteromyces radiatus]KAI8096855.1 hypothetical protein BX664DRAFT_67859 [Halteromyces radiatus]